MERWIRNRFTPNLPLYREKDRVTASREHVGIAHEVALEGMVLLKNENRALPLARGSRIALFGKAVCDYVKGGEGSGLVNSPYARSLADGLELLSKEVSVFPDTISYYRENLKEQYAEGKIPGLTEEPKLPEEMVMRARSFADTAVLSFCRTSGEGWDATSSMGGPKEVEECNQWMANFAEKLYPNGSFYLNEAEKSLVTEICTVFPHVIVCLNTGIVMDTSWIRDNPAVSAALLMWQGGMEGGLAAAQLLLGDTTPCGHLADTIPYRLEDIPSTSGFHDNDGYVEYTEDIFMGYRYFYTIPNAAKKVCYPFGYGLSYTSFSVENTRLLIEGKGKAAYIEAVTTVTNVGAFSGKEVVQLYLSAPQGKLGKAAKVLAAYQKTPILSPGETVQIRLSFALKDFASYDDTGKIQKSAYILEAGTYRFFLGTNVRDAVLLNAGYVLEQDVITEQLTECLTPSQLSRKLCADGTYQKLQCSPYPEENYCGLMRQSFEETEAIVPASRARKRYKLSEWPCGNPTLNDVADGRISLDEFISAIPDEMLTDLLGGQPNTGIASSQGIGNIPEFGVPNVMTSDGPAGINIQKSAGITTTAFPCSTLLACTWNPDIVYEVGRAGAEELKENNLSVWLTPAINLHRSPLCGRNFEYYSEDPLLAGRQAAALVRGIQSLRVGCCVKHFALNGKETNRKMSDTRVTERAARELYLKPFEIVIKEASPWSVMGAYNMINGVRACENRDLLTTILRNEWHFTGFVTTDWWTTGEQYREILAGTDLKMGCGFPERLLKAMEIGIISRKDLEQAGKRLLAFILKLD